MKELILKKIREIAPTEESYKNVINNLENVTDKDYVFFKLLKKSKAFVIFCIISKDLNISVEDYINNIKLEKDVKGIKEEFYLNLVSEILIVIQAFGSVGEFIKHCENHGVF